MTCFLVNRKYTGSADQYFNLYDVFNLYSPVLLSITLFSHQ